MTTTGSTVSRDGASPNLLMANVAGSIYASTIADQLVQERARKASIEQRAFGLVTASGAILTIFGALVANAVPKPAAPAPGQPTPPLLTGVSAEAFGAAVVLLLLAAGLGLLANYWANATGSFAEIPIDDLQRWASEPDWVKQNPTEAAQTVACVEVARLKKARGYNTLKKFLFAVGVAFEIAGLAAVVVVLVGELTR